MIIQHPLLVGSEISKLFQSANIDAVIGSHLQRSELGRMGHRIQIPIYTIVFEQTLIVGKVHPTIGLLVDHPVLVACMVDMTVVVDNGALPIHLCLHHHREE